MAALVVPLRAAHAGISAIEVRDAGEFAAAVSALRNEGGTIKLLRNDYERELVVRARPRHRLRIIGRPGVRVQSLLLDHAQRVSVAHLTIAPVTEDAWIKVYHSRDIEIHDVLVTAARTRYRATVHVPDSSHVVIRRSEFRHCGDRSELFSNCLHVQQRARHVSVINSWFHDCRGCDFIHGRFGVSLTLRGNRFERSLPCTMDRDRCGHQDLVQLSSGRGLLVARNAFGIYKRGAAQLYLAAGVDHVTIVNNVFRGTDPRVPGYRARVALIVGSRGQARVPLGVRIVNNTILAGARRIDGYAGSIRMSGVYRRLQRRKRPLLANNVIGLVEDPHHVCSVARAAVANVVLRGIACRGTNRAVRVPLDAKGEPTSASDALIDRASRQYAPKVDFTGRRRGPKPDIGAYEYGRTRTR
jgi:hypothetical protein